MASAARAAIAVAAIVVYANSLSGVFTFDDVAAITGNESIRRLWPLSGPLSPPARGEPVAGRPLVNLSFAINYAVGGLDVTGYHVVNIALHVACALLLFALIRHSLASDEQVSAASATHVAFAAALIWTVHPLLTETVTYVSQRTELMASLFYLLTLYGSARGRTALAIVACALGMACKETMVTAPLMVVLYDRVFTYPSLRDAFRARWRLYAGLAATWLLLAALISSGPRWESAGFATGISPWTYLLNQSVLIVEYLKRVVWPVRLVLDYGEPRAFTLADVAWQAALVVALLVVTGVALLKRPAAGFAAAAFFLILAPTTSIVPIATEVGAERRMYLPLAALIVLVVVAARTALLHVGRGPGRELRRGPSWYAGGALALAVIPLAVLTIQRNSDYADERRLWETTLERWPTARAHRNYATVLKRAGYRDEVIDHLRLSLDGHPEGRYALGFELFEQGRYAEAIDELRQFTVDVPNDRFVTTARGLVAESLQRLGRLDEAIQEYEGVAAASPQSEPAWRGLGLALAQAGRHGEAIAALERAIALDAANGAARRAIAALLVQEDKPADALPHAEAAVRLAPSDSAARFVSGVALIGVGRMAEAERALRAAIELDPSNRDARDLLSRVEALR